MPETVMFYCARCHASRKFLRKGNTYICEACGKVVYPREADPKPQGGKPGSRR